MGLYNRFIGLIDLNLVYSLIPIILTLILIEILFKGRFETRKALNLVRWIILIYTSIILMVSLIGITLYPNSAFFNRVTGSHRAVYWLILLSTFILPFTLFAKKLASKFWYVLIVASCMKIGVYFERFVIISTSLHRDYTIENESSEFTNLISFGFGMLFLQGVVIATLILGVYEVRKRYHSKKEI